MLKLNTNGSSEGNPGPSSFGGLIRDGKGGYAGTWEKQREKRTDCEAVMRLGWKEAHNDHPLKSIRMILPRVDIGTSEPLLLDILINAMTQISSDHVGIKQMVLGGSEYENWSPNMTPADEENKIALKSRWTFPGVNMLKLNTDGSSKGNTGPSSFGGLIRDGKGRWICGYMGKIKGKMCTAFEAELWSVYKGLCLIKKNMSNLFIKTDCEALMRLRWKEADNDHPLKLIMYDITMMMKEQKCVMLHTRRDGNQCADHMARLVIFRSPVINARYRISGTHVNPLGLKSDAPMEVKNHLVKPQPSEDSESVILAKELVLQSSFARTVASLSKAQAKKVVRILPNLERHWGPKLRARLPAGREIWLAVKARFDGNEESKKMRKTMLKHAFSEFSVSEKEGLHKGYDRGGLEYLSFDDLYNKLRSFEIDVKGGSSYGSRSTTIAPIHSAFIGAASTSTKMVYSDQPNYSSSISYTPAPSGSIMEDVLHCFVAKNEPTQQLAYEDFEQVDQLEMEELDIKWQMAMLSLRINKF
nr:ribonuclease H protein [Tanacetum cinerariifolium]